MAAAASVWERFLNDSPYSEGSAHMKWLSGKWLVILLLVVVPLLLLAISILLGVNICILILILLWIGFALIILFIPESKEGGVDK